MTKTRTDTHRPSIMDPAEYIEVGFTDLHPEEGGHWMEQEVDNSATSFQGAFLEYGGCDHCGHHGLRYVVHYLHTPSNEVVNVGQTCAGKLGLDSRDTMLNKQRAEREGRKARIAKLREGDDVIEWLLTWSETDYSDRFPQHDDFLSSLASQLTRRGELSEKQIAALAKSRDRIAAWKAERDAERAAEPDPTPVPDTDERIAITGKIISSKIKETMYGDRHVMTVLDDRGFKVWGSQPESLEVEQAQDEGGWIQHADGKFYRPADRGDRVTFMAKVERSDRDETFGFFKRPTKAEVID